MSEFMGINQFGNLTLKNGTRLSFDDIKDINGDGKISTDEFKKFLKENNVDTITLTLVDTNGDKEITEEEFAVLEQKQQMQEAINSMSGDISFDFAGTKLIPEITAKLKELITTFANEYTGEVSDMAKDFASKLPETYEAIKNEILSKDPGTIQTNVINDIVVELSEDNESDSVIKSLAKGLESAAAQFAKTYSGADLATDLKTYLENWLTADDKTKMEGSINTYKKRLDTLGATIESGEVEKLKYAAKELLTGALKEGVTVKLGQQTVTTANLTKVLNKYTDGEALKSDLQTFIDGLSSDNKIEQARQTVAEKAQAEADKILNGLKGSDFTVNASLIDYSGIEGYERDEQYEIKGKDNQYQIYDKVRSQLESLKEQFKAQFTSVLESKGASSSEIEQIFENAFQETVNQIVYSLDTHKTNHKWLNKNKTYAANDGIQTIVQNFVTAFNTNITARIDEKNQSNTDMDVVDIDYTVMAKDESGNVTDQKLFDTLQNGRTDIDFGTDVTVAEDKMKEMIEKLRAQMLQKAKNMCLANGVKFDNQAFVSIFNNAKNKAATQSSANLDLVVNLTNPKEAASVFVNEFKTNFTSWVNTEKAKAKNK